MADIVFRPTFSHKEFVDGPDGDRVRADEPNGFNARFAAIETDLHQLALVVEQIDAAVDARGSGPVGHLLDLPPMLRTTSANALDWTITANGAAQAQGKNVYGLMELELPDNATLSTFRAVGQGSASAQGVAVSLSRVRIPGGTPEVLASVDGGPDPFDATADIDPALATTVTATYRYIIQASVVSTDEPVTIAAFQIAYTTS
ncbi:hypothetical protein [Streptomyces sp. NPDC008092]|uniref:hypothetical protein n=1 Tax=Streptomyces sp. NPDC008092 TaxID=3364808 RepID=UPI0036EC04D1